MTVYGTACLDVIVKVFSESLQPSFLWSKTSVEKHDVSVQKQLKCSCFISGIIFACCFYACMLVARHSYRHNKSIIYFKERKS